MTTTVQRGFGGLRVAAFESRRATEMARMLERAGAVASVSPSMREVPLAGNEEASAFARRLIAGDFDIVILMTGVGLRLMLQALDGRPEREPFLRALAGVSVIARGPKPVAALKEVGLRPTVQVPEPNTWREVLEAFDAKIPLAGKRVAVQEYGLPNTHLIVGLEARGAAVTRVRVYQWELPRDAGPLEANLRAVAAGRVDVILFTSSQQVIHALQVAKVAGIETELRAALATVVVASIGPTTSETLREQGLPVDLEPAHSKMGHLIREAAERSPALLERKRRLAGLLTEAERTPIVRREHEPSWDSPFMRACRREPVDCTPIWLMRQAGRYMPEYRSVREQVPSVLELCKNPALCADIAIGAAERLGVDAAIIFSDILPIVEPMGMELEFIDGDGPVIHNPVRDSQDVRRVTELESVDALDFVMETVRTTRRGLPQEIPLIGFAAAPFTLASYMVEGGTSRTFVHTKTLMYRDESAWNALMQRLARSIARYLNAQIAAGAQAVQIFDSWVGTLGVEDYRRCVLRHTKSVIDELPPGVPVIHFATGNPALLPALAEAGGDVISVDWRVRLDDAWRSVGHGKAVQGNLDPLVLLAEPAEIRRRAKAILDQAGGRPGHIFNLGHGVIPQTPVENVIELVRAVHELGSH